MSEIEPTGRRLRLRGAGGLQSALLQVPKHAGGAWAGARARCSADCLGKDESPREYPARPALTASGEQGTLGRVKARKPRLVGPTLGLLGARGKSSQGNGRRVHPGRKRLGVLSGGKHSEGRNPRSAVGMKQGRRGLGGRKPPRGWPNPEGGTKRARQTRDKWTPESRMC